MRTPRDTTDDAGSCLAVLFIIAAMCAVAWFAGPVPPPPYVERDGLVGR